MNSSCPDYRGIADMICEEIRAKDAALAEAQARIEALTKLVCDMADFNIAPIGVTATQYAFKDDAELMVRIECARAAAGV